MEEMMKKLFPEIYEKETSPYRQESDFNNNTDNIADTDNKNNNNNDNSNTVNTVENGDKLNKEKHEISSLCSKCGRKFKTPRGMQQHLRKCQVSDTGQPPTQPPDHLDSLKNQTTIQQADQPNGNTPPSPESFYWGESKVM